MSAARVKSNPNAENGNGVYHSLNMDVPDHWKVVPLEEVLDNIIGGGTPSKANPENWIGSIPWLSVKDMRTRRPQDAMDHISMDAVRDSATNIISADTVIIATRIGLGKVIRVPYDAAINQDLKALVTKPEIEKGFLEYWILSIAEYLESIGSGTTVKGIRLEQLRSLPFPLAPRSEQKYIVSEIEKQFSRLDEAVANLKRVKANLKRYKAAVLKAAVEGRLTEDWRKKHSNVEPASKLFERILTERRAQWNGRGKYKEPAGPETSNLSLLPRGWTWGTVEQLAAGSFGAIQSGPFGSQLLHSEFVQDGILAIGIDNVPDGKFSLGRQHRITPVKFKTLQKFEARPRDVVITVMATVGRVCVLPQVLERAIITKHCYRITPAHGIVDPEFLAIALRADSSTRQHIFGNVRGQTRPGINGSILKAAPVSLPPFAEQKEIVAEVERRLSVIDELQAAVRANLTRADRLRQSILGQAFSGKLSPGSC